MSWQSLLGMIWELIKEWEVVKETLFQKLLARDLPYELPFPDDLSNLSIIVTGATSGIGLQAARQLAMAGAHVIMACRNVEAANNLASKWKEEARDGKILNVEVMELDLASLSSVGKFAKEWEHRGDPLHVLINNAGILQEGEQKFTIDGIEQHIHVNHVAPALLTLLLLPSLLRASSSRVIHVNSVAHYCGVVETQHWNSRVKDEKYTVIKAYGSSKLAHLMFLKAFAVKLLDEKMDSIQSIAVHPGAVTTNLNPYSKSESFYTFDANEGARSAIFCATNDSTKHHLTKGFAYYTTNCKLGKVSHKAADMNDCIEVWNKTMDILGLSRDYLSEVLDNSKSA